MEKIREVKGHAKIMSDSPRDYAGVPKGAHFVPFEQVPQWQQSISECRMKYEGATSDLKTRRK
jgi:hypothetical protein